MVEAAKLWLSFLNDIDKSFLPNSIILFNGMSFPECIIKFLWKEME